MGRPRAARARCRPGRYPVEGTAAHGPGRLNSASPSDDFGYLSTSDCRRWPGRSLFASTRRSSARACWTGPVLRPAPTLVDRARPIRAVQPTRTATGDQVYAALPPFDSMLTELRRSRRAPELLPCATQIRAWRFYDGFRVDAAAPARRPRSAPARRCSPTTARDLAAAVQTIREIGDRRRPRPRRRRRVRRARPSRSRWTTGCSTSRCTSRACCARWRRRTVRRHPALPAAGGGPADAAAAVADGAQRAGDQPAPRPAAAAGRLIASAATRTQVVVVTHSAALATALQTEAAPSVISLEKELGVTRVAGLDRADMPRWIWPGR